MQMPPCLRSTFKIKYLLILNWWHDCKKGSIIVETFFKTHYTVRYWDVVGLSLGAQLYPHCPKKTKPNHPLKTLGFTVQLCAVVLFLISHTYLLIGAAHVSPSSPSLPAPLGRLQWWMQAHVSLLLGSINSFTSLLKVMMSGSRYPQRTPGHPKTGHFNWESCSLRLYNSDSRGVLTINVVGFTLMFTIRSLDMFNKY